MPAHRVECILASEDENPTIEREPSLAFSLTDVDVASSGKVANLSLPRCVRVCD